MKLLKEGMSQKEYKAINKALLENNTVVQLYDEILVDKNISDAEGSTGTILDCTAEDCWNRSIKDTDEIITATIKVLMLVKSISKFVDIYKTRELVPGWKLEQKHGPTNSALRLSTSVMPSVLDNFLEMTFTNRANNKIAKFKCYLFTDNANMRDISDFKNSRVQVAFSISDWDISRARLIANGGNIITLEKLKAYIVNQLEGY